MRELKLYWGVIFITILSLFHFIWNSQHPGSEYLPISSNLLKKSLGKTSLSVLTVTGLLEKSVLLAVYLLLL